MSETKILDATHVSTAQKQKKSPQKQRTYRFDLCLGESNAETCPEFSFLDFIKKEKPHFGEPFEDVREIAAIAQRFEAKYGPKGLQSGKKARTQEMDDYYDPGEGYDEDDPFIDNTEAYDEVIPSSMTTQHGGFYINQGRLDFRNLNEEPSDIRKARNRKKTRILESDAEDETGPALAKKFHSLKRKKRSEGKQLKTKTKLVGVKEGQELVVKKKQRLKVNSGADAVPQKDKTDLSAASTVVAAASNGVGGTAPSRSMVTGDGVDAGGEAFRDDQLKSIEDIFNSVLNDNMNEDSCSNTGEEGKGENQLTERNTQLPAQLPPELLAAIENMKREAKESKEKKFFSAYINKLLLDIELGSHKLPWGSKTAIYNHLSEHLPCGKYTLQRRAKKLRESEEEDQLKGPIRRLREAIMKVMPVQQQQHELEIQKAKTDGEVQEELADVVKEEISTESEGEEKSDAKKKPRGPRRKFQWNSEIRNLLLGIITTKVKHYSTFKSRNQSAEEYLKAYLDSEIKSLWPQGWMQTRILFKEGRKAHEELTKGGQQQGKQRKAFTSLDAAQATTEMANSQTLKKAAVELTAVKIKNTPPHVSNTEHVIEVSTTILDAGSKNKDTVIINLPNSMGSLPQTFHNSTPSSTLSNIGHLSNHSTKTSVALPQFVEISVSPITSFVAPNPSSTSISTSVKEEVPADFQEIIKILSAAANEPQSINLALSHGSSDSKMAVPATLVSSINSSYPESLGDLNNNGSAKLIVPSPSQQQQVRDISKQMYSQRPKVSALLQNAASGPQTTNITQPTQSAVIVATAESLQQKSDSKLSPQGLMKNSNSSWTSVTSVVPSGQSVSPIPVNKAANSSTLKHSSGLGKTGASVQENQVSLLQSQQQKMPHVSGKSNLSILQKQNLGNVSSTSSIVHPVPGIGTLNKPSVASVKTTGSSFKADSTNLKFVQYPRDQKKSGPSNQQIQSGVIMTKSSSAPMLNTQNQRLRTGIIIGTGALPLFKPQTAADFAEWTSKKSKAMKQSSPLGTTIMSAQTTATVSVARSSPIPFSSLPNKSPSLFNNTSSSPMSRTSTPSPQMSPMSPAEVTALSLYEQIRTQVQNQDAIEGQALKNLAMALKLGGSAEADIFGTKSGTAKEVGRTSQLCSKISGGRAVVHPDNLQPTSLSSCSPVSKIENMQGTDCKEFVSGTVVKTSSTDLNSSSCHQKAFQKHEQFSSAINSANQNRNFPVLENKKVVHSQPYSERSLVFKDKFSAEILHDGAKLLPASCETGTTKNSVSSVLKRQGSHSHNSSFQSRGRDHFIASPMLPNSTLKFPTSRHIHASSSDLLPNTKRHIRNESLVTCKKRPVHPSSVSSTHGHANIFSKIDPSIPGRPLSAQTAKDWFSSNSCPEKVDTSTSRSVKSLPHQLQQTLQTSSSTVPHKSFSQSSLGPAEREQTNEKGSSNSRSPGSFQDAFSQYANHLLKDFAPCFNSSNKMSQLESPNLNRSCNEDVSQPVRSNETTEPERHLGQDSNAKSSQEA